MSKVSAGERKTRCSQQHPNNFSKVQGEYTLTSGKKGTKVCSCGINIANELPEKTIPFDNNH